MFIMNDKLIETIDDTIFCDKCSFDENCEELFTECVANYAKTEEYNPDEICHLKYCERIFWNELSDEEKQYFINEVLKKKRLVKND